MNEREFNEPRSARIRRAIHQFLEERRDAKLKPIRQEETQKRQEIQEKFRPVPWIRDGARRASQIQQATHAPKFTHPDAKGTSLNVAGNPAAGEDTVGSHTIAHDYTPDVVGNAAALDVYAFLRITVDNAPLLDWALAQDPALSEAFTAETGDPDEARQWIDAFTSLTEANCTPQTHTLAKQIYWPLDEGGYHLLAPLYPTSLVHTVHSRIRDDRFEESNKVARQARRDGKPYPHGYRDYPNLVIQKFGGTKPQNISQLNNQRNGESYLLASVPPEWHSQGIRPPLGVENIFRSRFGRLRSVRALIDDIRGYLKRVQGLDNWRVRRGRQQRVDAVIDELVQFAAQLHELEPGWTARPECRLPEAEQCWLDPGRIAIEPTFAAMCQATDWRETIITRFANWLNNQLTDDRLLMSESEQKEWRRVLDQALPHLRTELETNE